MITKLNFQNQITLAICEAISDTPVHSQLETRKSTERNPNFPNTISTCSLTRGRQIPPQHLPPASLI